MKIRIKGNSIRIRLTRTEVARFGEAGLLEEKTEFGHSEFKYVLKNVPGPGELSAEFTSGTMIVIVPEHITREWVSTDIIGFEHNMDLGNGKQLFLLIEKDFKCLDKTSEDQSDNFEHPGTKCA